ncbi:hypothetical protein VPHD285_0103 [Vibrio phage D285]
MSHIEQRIAKGEPLIYPREVLFLGFLSTFLIVTSVLSSIILVQSYGSVVQLLTLPPLAVIYSMAYRNAQIHEFRYELVQILELEEEQVKDALETFEKELPEPWFNRFFR